MVLAGGDVGKDPLPKNPEVPAGAIAKHRPRSLASMKRFGLLMFFLEGSECASCVGWDVAVEPRKLLGGRLPGSKQKSPWAWKSP